MRANIRRVRGLAAPALALASLSFGCLSPATTTCDDGSVCAAGLECAPGGGCIDPDIGTACEGKEPGDACQTSGLPDGVCALGLCIPAGCGNAVVEPGRGEVCDDGNREAGDGCSATCASDETCGNGVIDYSEDEGCDCGDGTGDLPPGCVEANGDAAGASCFSDCTPHRCGDGLREGLEACEGADLQDLTCEDVGFYAGDLACDDACRFDTTTCSGSCGDGEINGPEFCEEFVEGSCVLYGLDYGRPDCNALCGISLSACGSFATPEVAQAFNDETVLTTAWSDGNVVQLAGPQYLVCTGICLPYGPRLAYDGAAWDNGPQADWGVVGLTGVDADHVYGAISDQEGTVSSEARAVTFVDGAATLIEMPAIHSRVAALHSRTAGEFAFGTETGEVGRWVDGVTTVLATLGSHVGAVLETADGELIVSTYQDGWYHVDAAGTATHLTPPLARGSATMADASGDYVADVTGRVARVDGGTFTVLTAGAGEVTQILRDVDGALLSVGAGRLLRIDRGLTTIVRAGGVTAAFLLGGVLHAVDSGIVHALPWPRHELSLLTPPASVIHADATGTWSIVSGNIYRGDLPFFNPGAFATDLTGRDGVIAVAAGNGVWRWTELEGWLNLGDGAAMAAAAPASPGSSLTRVWLAPDGILFAASGTALRRWDGAWTSFDLGVFAPQVEAVGLTGSSSTDVYVTYLVDLVPSERNTKRFDGAAVTSFFTPFGGTHFQDQPYQLLAVAPDELYTSFDGETQRFDGVAWTLAWPDATSGLAVGPDGELWGVMSGSLATRDEHGWLPIRGDLTADGRPVVPLVTEVIVPRASGGAMSLWRR